MNKISILVGIFALLLCAFLTPTSAKASRDGGASFTNAARTIDLPVFVGRLTNNDTIIPLANQRVTMADGSNDPHYVSVFYTDSHGFVTFRAIQGAKKTLASHGKTVVINSVNTRSCYKIREHSTWYSTCSFFIK